MQNKLVPSTNSGQALSEVEWSQFQNRRQLVRRSRGEDGKTEACPELSRRDRIRKAEDRIGKPGNQDNRESEDRLRTTENRRQNTEYRIQNTKDGKSYT
jgi:hypothetical protein